MGGLLEVELLGLQLVWQSRHVAGDGCRSALLQFGHLWGICAQVLKKVEMWTSSPRDGNNEWVNIGWWNSSRRRWRSMRNATLLWPLLLSCNRDKKGSKILDQLPPMRDGLKTRGEDLR